MYVAVRDLKVFGFNFFHQNVDFEVGDSGKEQPLDIL